MPRLTDIDRLYGLEPVFEPSDNDSADAVAPVVEVDCPYCGELLSLQLDLSAGSQCYIEDCQVCCQAMQVDVQVDGDGALQHVAAERLDR